ncbi:MAG: hypothetical protein NZ761_10015, partial [Dehalococcoidia bacterium]|nr:hypothetical protein [Dehalococcoidia bacterium]
MRFDNATPADPYLTRANGWLNDVEARRYRQPVRVAAKDTNRVPSSGIAGYSVALDEEPDETLDIQSDHQLSTQYTADWVLTELSEGIHEVASRSISGSGVASSRVDRTYLRVDRTQPELQVQAPPAGSWQTRPARLAVVARDQEHLSGMRRTESDREDGGYIQISTPSGSKRCDGQSKAEASCTVDLVEDGRHHVAYEAVDVAGNRTPRRATVVLIDKTPPGGWLERPQAPEAAVIRGTVVDSVSGVAAARFEIRPEGSGTWRPLPTEKVGDGRFQANVRDDELPAGRYEVRLLVKDLAGNVGAIDTFKERTGARSAAVVVLPLRSQPRFALQTPLRPRRAKPALAVLAWFDRSALVVSGRVEPSSGGHTTVKVAAARRVISTRARIRAGRFVARVRVG